MCSMHLSESLRKCVAHECPTVTRVCVRVCRVASRGMRIGERLACMWAVADHSVSTVITPTLKWICFRFLVWRH